MNTDIYSDLSGHIAECVKLHEPEYVIKRNEDPAFLTFVQEVSDAAGTYNRTDVAPRHKLFSLWFMSTSFRKQWDTSSKSTPSQMAFNCMAFWEMSMNEIAWIVIAWMRHHGRNPTRDEIKAEVTPMLQRVYPAAMEQRQKVRDDRNAKRREKRKMNPTEKKRGRPSTGIQDQIIAALKDERSTPIMLSAKLGHSIDTIQSHLQRMKKAKLVTTIVRGLYELVEVKEYV